MALSHFGDFDCNSTANQFLVQSQCSLSAVSVESPFPEDSQCYATLWRLHGDYAETDQRIICSQSRQSLRAAEANSFLHLPIALK